MPLLIAFSRRDLDLSALPKRSLLKALAAHAVCPPERAKLMELATTAYGTEIGNIVDLLEKFHSCRPPVGTLLQLLPKMQPRSYTVSSSPRQSPKHVHITFNLQTFGPSTAPQSGLCSNFLSQLTAGQDTICAELAPSSFEELLISLPQLDARMILVGAGTGLAPMRAMLQERLHLASSVSNIDLFFGCCHPDRDLIYEEELGEMEAAGANH